MNRERMFTTPPSTIVSSQSREGASGSVLIS